MDADRKLKEWFQKHPDKEEKSNSKTSSVEVGVSKSGEDERQSNIELSGPSTGHFFSDEETKKEIVATENKSGEPSDKWEDVKDETVDNDAANVDESIKNTGGDTEVPMTDVPESLAPFLQKLHNSSTTEKQIPQQQQVKATTSTLFKHSLPRPHQPSQQEEKSAKTKEQKPTTKDDDSSFSPITASDVSYPTTMLQTVPPMVRAPETQYATHFGYYGPPMHLTTVTPLAVQPLKPLKKPQPQMKLVMPKSSLGTTGSNKQLIAKAKVDPNALKKVSSEHHDKQKSSKRMPPQAAVGRENKPEPITSKPTSTAKPTVTGAILKEQKPQPSVIPGRSKATTASKQPLKSNIMTSKSTVETKKEVGKSSGAETTNMESRKAKAKPSKQPSTSMKSAGEPRKKTKSLSKQSEAPKNAPSQKKKKTPNVAGQGKKK